MQVIATNTKTMESQKFQTLAHAIETVKPVSAKTGYTFKIRHAITGEEIGNIRPNPRQYKTKSNPNGKLTARFIRHD